MSPETLQKQRSEVFSFEDYRLEPATGRLLRDGRQIALNAKYLDVLIYLVRARERVVSKDELFASVWGQVHVSDGALTQCIKDIRKALDDKAGKPRFIKTLPKRGYQFIATVTSGQTEQPASANQPVKRPYKFLESFGEEDAADFHGRTQERELIMSHLISRRTFLIYGRSGVGKSSLLAAGLVPDLRRAGYSVHRLRGRLNSEHLLETCLTLPTPGQTVFLCFDQLEEWFLSPGGRAELGRLFEALNRAPASGRLHFCFVLREDYLAEMSGFKDYFPEIFHHEYRLELPARAAAEHAMRAPAQKIGCRFEDGLLERILDDLSGPDGVDLPSLQIVCDQLFDQRDQEGVFTLEAYSALGNTGGILQRYLDRVLRRFSGDHLNGARHLLSLLISEDGDRLVREVEGLLAEVQDVSGLDATPVLEELASARVLHVGRDQGKRLVSLVHQVLAPVVAQWMTDSMRRARKIREVLRRALETYAEHQFAMSAESLKLVLAGRDAVHWDAAAAELVSKSCLDLGVFVPKEIADACPCFATLWRDALPGANRDKRLNAVACAANLPKEHSRDVLADIALNDASMTVRREACTLLAEAWLEETPEILREAGQGTGRDWMRRYLIALAIVRDLRRGIFSLWKRSPMVSAFIVFSLAWVRMRRNWRHWSRTIVGGTLGASAAGLVIGFALGLVVVLFRPELNLADSAVLIAFSCTGLVAGLLAGAAVSTAMSAMVTIAYRHSRMWAVFGGAAGGLLTGAMFDLVARSFGISILGNDDIHLTGAIEAGLMGASVCLGAVLFERASGTPASRRAVLGAGLVGGLCALTLVFFERRLLAGSLSTLIAGFQVLPEFESFLTNSGMTIGFRQLLALVEAFAEGAAFGIGLFGGIALFQRNQERPASSSPMASVSAPLAHRVSPQ